MLALIAEYVRAIAFWSMKMVFVIEKPVQEFALFSLKSPLPFTVFTEPFLEETKTINLSLQCRDACVKIIEC
jgi:hypothetical protein